MHYIIILYEWQADPQQTIHGWKLETWAGDIYKGTLYIEFEQDWSVGLVATYAMNRKWKTILFSFRDFSGYSR